MLAAAVTLFIEQGYDATSVADLAARLGLTKSALYHHFESKEQLLEMALDEALGGLEGVLDEPGARAVRGGAPRLRAARGRAGAAGPAALRHAAAARPRQQRRRAAALERRRAFDHEITGMVREAQAEGSVRADVDSRRS